MTKEDLTTEPLALVRQMRNINETLDQDEGYTSRTKSTPRCGESFVTGKPG